MNSYASRGIKKLHIPPPGDLQLSLKPNYHHGEEPVENDTTVNIDEQQEDLVENDGIVTSSEEEIIFDQSEYVSNEELLNNYIHNNDIESVIKIINEDIDVNAANYGGERPLLLAVWNGNYEISEILIQAGADPNLGSNQEEFIPLEAAVIQPPPYSENTKQVNDIMDLVRLLLNNGADPNVVSDNSSIDGDQTTVLTRAVGQNYGSQLNCKR